MSQIELNGKLYEAKATSHEITLKDAIAISKIKMPSKLKKFYSKLMGNHKREVKFSNHDLDMHFPKYAKEVIKILVDIPAKELNDVGPKERFIAYQEVFENEVFSILYEGCRHEVVNLEEFTIGDVTYHLPKSVSIMKIERPMAYEPFLTWSEVDDLLNSEVKIANGHLEAAKHIVSIMCRPIDEKTEEIEVYDEAKSLERADIFLDLPMYIIWEVFFCTAEQQYIFSVITAYKRADRQRSKQRLLKPLESLPSDGSPTLTVVPTNSEG